MPVDTKPVEGGTLVLRVQAGTNGEPLPNDSPLALDYRTAEKLPAWDAGAPRYSSHFATCPAAARFRR